MPGVGIRDLKIKSYITNGELPYDIKEYEYPASKSSLCPFCESNHEEYKQHVHGDAAFYVCGECDFRCNVIRLRDSAAKQLNSGERTSRLELYIQEGELGHEAHKWASSFKDSCYFCRRSVDLEGAVLELEVPIGDDSNGGILVVCPGCAEHLDWEEHHHKFEDQCVNCGNSYPITSTEHNARASVGQHYGSYLCSRCFVAAHGSLKQDRFLERQCKKCNAVKVIDLFSVVDRRDVPSMFNYTCRNCSVKEASDRWAGIIQLPDSAHYFARLFNDPHKSKWGYDVCVFRGTLGDFEHVHPILRTGYHYSSSYTASYEATLSLLRVISERKAEQEKLF